MSTGEGAEDEGLPYADQFAAVVAEVARRANTSAHAVEVAYATLSCIMAGELAEADDNMRLAAEEAEGAEFRAGVERALEVIRQVNLGLIYINRAGNN